MKSAKIKLVGVALGALAPTVTAAQDEMPKKSTWTAYGTTSSGYAQSVAISNMLKKHYGTNVRIIPGKNDISRMAPLRDDKADYCACGIAAYFGQEGVFLFADEAWGPQPIRVVVSSSGNANLANNRFTPTPTPTPTRTQTPTNTPSVTPTRTPTSTPTRTFHGRP